jgi:hypothetical protein
MRAPSPSQTLSSLRWAYAQPADAVTVIAVAQTYSNNQQDIVDRSLSYNSFNDYWVPPQYSYELGTDSNNVERGYIGTTSGSDMAGGTARAHRMSIGAIVYDGSNQTIYDSGVEQATAAVSGDIVYDNPNEHDLYIGVHNAGYFGLGGYGRLGRKPMTAPPRR